MRITTSAIALIAIIVATFSPTLGQASRRLPSRKEIDPVARPIERVPQPKTEPRRRIPVAKTETQFASLEAFTEGTGVWIRWRMEVERKNLGFTLYSLSKNGEQVISNLIPGSSFTYGDQPYRGGEYYHYHRDGDMNHAYRIEAMDDDGRTVRTKFIAPSYVPAIEGIDGGAAMKADTFAFKPGANIAKQDLLVSYELQKEVRNGLIEPNPSKHREVISQPGARITSRADGLIRVSRSELENGGFDLNSDPANWQIYLQGVELPMIVGPNADYIEFFGKGLDTRESDIRTYYLTSGNTAGRRILSQTVRKPVATIVSRKYDQTFARQDKKLYANQILNGDDENWWGDVIASGFFDYTFSLSGIDRTPGTRRMTVDFQGFSITPHTVELVLNGTPLQSISGAGRFPFAGVLDVPVDALLEGQNTLRMRSVGAQGDVSLLAKLTIEFPRNYVAMSDKLQFYTENYKNASVSGFTTQNIRVFDITYENEPRLLTNIPIVQTNGTWGPVMPAARERVLYAAADGVFGNAMSVTPNDPGILADPGNTGTMVLIAHPSFVPQAQTWAAYRAGQGISTKVIDVTDIYDEFSYGVLSSHAIEDFLNYTKTNWQTPPSYVMLFGEAHYDSRNYGGAGYWNMVPSRLVDTLFMETGSDEALSDFNNDGLAEIPIGRAASRDAAGITGLFNKTVAWEAALNANSLNRGALFAYDLPDGYNFEAMSNRVMANLPASMPKITVSRGSPTGQADIIAAVNEADGGTTQNPGPNAGQFILNYTGHGTSASWQNTGFFSSLQAPNLTNANYPSIMVALTCLNGYFMGSVDTFAEAMTRANNGGAVAVWASTGLTTPDVQEIMGTRFYQKVGEGNIPRMGDLIADAKARVPAGADVRLSWALLGDPMLKVR